MDILEAIRTRKSIRGYKLTPVPRETLEEIIDIARRSPSTMNTQPWEITVITGEVLDNIRQGNVEMLISGVTPEPNFLVKPYEGKYRQRQVDLAMHIFELMNIKREDKEMRAEWQQRGFRFFDAPAAIILSIDRSLQGVFPFMDLGLLAQTICLTALNYGLGTCIENQGIMFPEVIRKFAHIPESKRMVMSMAIGYPDWDSPANEVATKRETVEDIVTWCGFD